MEAAKETSAQDAPINGIDVAALRGVMREVAADPSKGVVEFRVRSAWRGQTRSRTTVESYRIGGVEVKRRFEIAADEPLELLGTNTAPNPQELLMSALNACLMVGYVVGAAAEGIALESVALETTGSLDLRGFLGLDPSVPAGYEALRTRVKIKGDGTAEQFRKVHEAVIRTSPNYFNIARPVRIEAVLEIER